MSKTNNKVLYILIIVLLIALPVILRVKLSSRQKSTSNISVVLGMPNAATRDFSETIYDKSSDVPPAFSDRTSDLVPPNIDRNINKEHPSLQSGPPESVLNEVERKNLSQDEVVFGIVQRMMQDNEKPDIGVVLASEDAKMRAVAVIFLLETEGWNRNSFDELVGLENVSTALWAAGWLADNGNDKDWEALVTALSRSDISMEDIHGILSSGELGSSAGRAALRLIAEFAPEGTLAAEYFSVLQNKDLPYSVRMMAAVTMAGTMSGEMYQSRIGLFANIAPEHKQPLNGYKEPGAEDDDIREMGDNHLNDEPPIMQQPEDPLILAGLARLLARLKVPDAVGAGTAISPYDIEMLNATMSPVALEDLAIQLEYIVSVENPTVYIGTAEQLEKLLKSLPAEPVSEEARIARQRLEALQGTVKLLEDPDIKFTDAPPVFLNQ